MNRHRVTDPYYHQRRRDEIESMLLYKGMTDDDRNAATLPTPSGPAQLDEATVTMLILLLLGALSGIISFMTLRGIIRFVRRVL